MLTFITLKACCHDHNYAMSGDHGYCHAYLMGFDIITINIDVWHYHVQNVAGLPCLLAILLR